MNGFLRLREISSVLLALVLVLGYHHLPFCCSLDDKGLVLLRSEENVVLEEDAVALSVSKSRNVAHRKLMQVATNNPFFTIPFWPIPNSAPSAPSPAPTTKPLSPSPAPAPAPLPFWPKSAPTPRASITPTPAHSSPKTHKRVSKTSSSNHHKVLILSGAIGGSLLLIALLSSVVFCQKNKMAVVKPWATGLSGQLQRAFVTGVPKLKRQELEVACEDFSNVVGSLSVFTLYKGTLSSGVEIAVVSLALKSSKDWSRDDESQFRKKIDTLSKVNHKNFVNLIGFCEEKEPFTRMMVFEYAPNGTLFEHLHNKEAEQLDWGMRMRIIMGISYCLAHMHQLTPPVPHTNLVSSAVQLAEDYAAKVSDFITSNNSSDETDSGSTPESNVYSFGLILFEVVTGIPQNQDFTSDYIGGRKSLSEMADPNLDSIQEQQLEGIGEVIRACLRLSPRLRPTMREISERLREITGIGPDGAVPKLSPLWWAELEILSTEAA